MKMLLAAALLAVTLTAPLQAAEDSAQHPVVVELFTSQGCSSCPPAEAYLAELAARKGVIALEYHVDYWDFIGWKDVFAKPEFTARQQAYVEALGARYVYTPQMVIAGAAHEVGSDRAAVERQIAKFRRDAGDGPAIALSRRDGNLEVEIGPGPVSGDNASGGNASGGYDVLFVAFDKPHVTRVTHGENRGVTLTNANVVRAIERIGTWRGAAAAFRVSMEGRDGDGVSAILVQERNHGPILAAAAMDSDGAAARP